MDRLNSLSPAELLGEEGVSSHDVPPLTGFREAVESASNSLKFATWLEGVASSKSIPAPHDRALMEVSR